MLREEHVSGGEVQLLVFDVDRLCCALPASEVREVLPMAALSTPPAMPELLSGLLNLGGELIPVVATEALFGLPFRPCHLHAALIVLADSDKLLALTAQRVCELAAIPPEELCPLREHKTLNDCVTAEFRMEDRRVHVLSTSRLLLREERERAHSFAAEEARRLQLIGGAS